MQISHCKKVPVPLCPTAWTLSSERVQLLNSLVCKNLLCLLSVKCVGIFCACCLSVPLRPCPAWHPFLRHNNMDPVHRGSRHVYQDAIPLGLCQELLFIQRSLAVVGYRPQVQSLTLYEMILTCPQLLPVVAKARQLIWDLVEAQFDSPCSVWPETTSLISWTAGASIGWHHDANR
jgi:hypothetical protein